MIKYTLYIPIPISWLNSSQGFIKKLHEEQDWLEAELLKFGGYTKEGTTEGMWVNENLDQEHDSSYKYFILINEDREKELLDLLPIIRDKFEQKKLLVEKTKPEVLFI